MKRYSDLVFDIDGTLLDTERTGVLSLVRTVAELTGREPSYEEAYGFFGIPSSTVAGRIGYADEDRFARVWEEHFQELMYMVQPFPGVEDVLRDARRHGYRTGVVTSRSDAEMVYDPHLAGLLPYFDVVIGSDRSERHKPFPDPMLAYLKAAGAESASTLYIGDTLHDWSCGHGAGCDFALADWRNRGDQGIAAEYRFTDEASLRGIIGL